MEPTITTSWQAFRLSMLWKLFYVTSNFSLKKSRGSFLSQIWDLASAHIDACFARLAMDLELFAFASSDEKSYLLAQWYSGVLIWLQLHLH